MDTDAGSIRARLTNIHGNGDMIGTVETLNPPSGTDLEIHGIRHNDSVIVHGMDFVNLVHTD